MNELQTVFGRMKETRQKQKEIRAMYKDQLLGNQEYQNIIDKLNELKEKKKMIENEIQNDMEADFQKLDAYKMHLVNDQELLADLALNQLVSGETVEIVDENDQKYEPIFSVKFKKV
ncbi:MAG TPA: hypothetical protein PKD34_02090 [Candidatus Doudnabacteria bacterium]|nr:hypothetical protein [Candidatus Doudnabacteria bacterium]